MSVRRGLDSMATEKSSLKPNAALTEGQETLLAYSRLFATVDGKRVWRDLMQTFVYTPALEPKDGVPSDPLAVAHRDGYKALVLWMRMNRTLGAKLMDELTGGKQTQTHAIMDEEE